MIKKVYKKLTPVQKARGVMFSSCLSVERTEQPEDCVHEVFNDEDIGEKIIKVKRLADDKFFSKSHFRYNIIRR